MKTIQSTEGKAPHDKIGTQYSSNKAVKWVQKFFMKKSRYESD